MKNLGILGSTGSIGTQSLKVIDNLKNLYDVKYLTANNNFELLAKQAIKYKPEIVCILNETKTNYLKKLLSGTNIKIISGRNALLELCKQDNIHLVINALVGSPGMEPTINIIKSGANIALSNKESLVMAGGIINQLLKKYSVKLFPIDSEHSAIWQCLIGEQNDQIDKIILTGSGGPFRTTKLNQFKTITIEQALKHPNWSMGNKITIDSATMMNKGLEVIEAHWLFNLKPNQIEIIIHPESIIHSMVQFLDGSIKAQLGLPDMKIPIQFSLTYPNHYISAAKQLNLSKIGSLNFENPDYKKFPCIKLAYETLNQGGSYPVVLNVANDEVVAAFLNKKINFVDIPYLIKNVLDEHDFINQNEIDLEIIDQVSNWTINKIQKYIKVYA